MANSNVQGVRRNPFVGTKFASAKAEFEARLGAIGDESLVSAIRNGVVYTVDCDIYANRYLGADTTIELMQSADNKKVGLTNINNRKLEANCYALITGVQMLAATLEADKNSESDVATAEYGVIPASIANGELEIKTGDKVWYPRNSNQGFVTTDADRLVGYKPLECPKMIAPLTDIIPTLWLPAAVENTAVSIHLLGVRTNRA